ncbi:MAG: cupredoxin domain-containing protein [Nitrosopumilaceae archaeon]
MKLMMTIAGLGISLLFLVLQSPSAFAEQVIIRENSQDYSCVNDNSCFEPSKTVIKKGQEVTWLNDDSSIHSIITSSRQFGSSGIISSGNISPEESFSYRFNSSGFVNYYCILHPWMQGLVVVE